MSKLMVPAISVAICTHNPRADYLPRVLEALRAQTFPFDKWEFIIIDNASTPPVASTYNLDWHPNARIIVESELGIASARIRAMREFAGDLLIFFDDDNVMAEDYLQRCIELFAGRLDLGAVSGCLLPEYEANPPEWFAPYEGCIAVRRINKSAWSNFLDSRSEPVTAGMCLRREIATAYVKATLDNPTQLILGSRGTSLLRGEDIALVKIALKLGYTIGQFEQLHILHLIPKNRVTPNYFFSLYRHQCASGYLLSWVDTMGREPVRMAWRTFLKSIFQLIKGDKIRRRLVIEEWRGFRLARKISKDWYGKKSN
jgi:glycosyltransferase involved in cell wall biosynthesis